MGDDQGILEAKHLLRPDEVANILRISRRQVYYLCDQGILEYVKINTSVRIKTESIKALLTAEY